MDRLCLMSLAKAEIASHTNGQVKSAIHGAHVLMIIPTWSDERAP